MYERLNRIEDNRVSYYSILISFMFLAFIGSIFIGSALLFYIKVPVNAVSFIIFPIITMIIGKFILNKDKDGASWRLLISMLVGFFVLIAILAVINNLIWDSSYDSLAYHQEAVIRFFDGWNPFYDSKNSQVNLWVMHYAKAPAIFAAALYKITGRIEAAKILTTLLPLILCLLSFGVFNLISKNRKWLSIFAAVILTLNPVIIGQSFSYYVDSSLGIYVIILLINLFLILFYEDLFFFKYFALINVAVFLINIKFTGLAYAGAILFGFLILSFIYHKKAYNVKLIVFLICGLIFSVIILGFNPYVTNTINNGNPLYPLAGKGKINIMTNNTPLDFRYDGQFTQEYESMMAFPNPKNFKGAPAKNLKQMFEINSGTLQYYSTTDARVRGFGVYSVIFIPLSFLGALYLLFTFKDRKFMLGGLLSVVLISAVAVAGGAFWWARYVPFLWALPLSVGFFMYLRKNRVVKVIGMCFLILMFVNSIIIVPGALYFKVQRSNQLKNYIFTKPLIITENNFTPSFINKAREYHLTYTLQK